MRNINLNDTIAAIATSIGESGIGIVRISGKDALSVADRVFISKDGMKPSSFKTYTTHYGWIISGRRLKVPGCTLNSENMRHACLPARQATCDMRQDIIDEVILTVMRAPKSYTREDIVEINCHGGIVALRRVLDLVLENGCRPADPGEFTKRAFLNGRIDLAQAEAVLDIIRAKTDAALKIGVEQLRGTLSGRINRVRDVLLEVLSLLEANIDFPDEGIDAVNPEQISDRLRQINSELKEILDNSRRGRIFREGIHVVICGRPNVGKSSLLNALLKQERSIVTPVAGTTRDTIEEIIDIKGIPIRIVDTAGIIEPRDLVEKRAVLRSKRQMDLADLVILIFDGSKKLNREDETLMRKLNKKAVIAVINKIDLKQKISRDAVLDRFKAAIEISAKNLKNINLLEEAVANSVYTGKVISSDSVMVSNLRHIASLRQAQKFIAQAADSLDNKLTIEFIAQDLKEALAYLDEVLGGRVSEDLLDKIFSEFCVGK